MGEDKKEEQKNEEVKEEQNKEEGPLEIVLKVDMHCEACARKVARALKGFGGVEEVLTDSKSNKVVVKGKEVDPYKVAERLQKKSGRKVELLSPLPNPSQSQEPKEEPNTEPKEGKKEEPPLVVTVVLKIQMHCEACAQALRKRIRKIKGVESVDTDLGKSQVVVKGVIEPQKLVDDVHKKTKKQASVVKEEEKKEEEKNDEKEKEKKETSDQEGKENLDEQSTITEIKRSEYWPSNYQHFGNANYDYPPQFFSDENPNACSLM